MTLIKRTSTMISEFLRLEAAGGILLMFATVFAMALANSAMGGAYNAFLDAPVAIKLGVLSIDKPLLLWINDGLMAIFFFLVGLEIKREFKVGELSSMSQVALPGIGAIGGMAIPALVYVGLNWDSPANLNGWAIPAATDIAFALAVLSLVGKHVPVALKVLLLAIAIFDDLGAILIIAFFYTSQLSTVSLALAAIPLLGLLALNLSGVNRTWPYIVFGIVLWFFVLKSGVHATLAGVVTALAIPMIKVESTGHTMLEDLEHAIHPWVAFGILPLFAFANAGVSFAGMNLMSFIEPVSLGISMGLFIGKQIGIFGFIWLAIKIGIVPMPAGLTWTQIYGVSLLAGIGFTMSLFIGSLAFEHTDFDAPIRLGVLTGSLLSAVVGYVVLSIACRKATQAQAQS